MGGAERSRVGWSLVAMVLAATVLMGCKRSTESATQVTGGTATTSADASSADPAVEPTSTTTTAPPPPTVPADAIRAIDFGNWTYPAEACSSTDPLGPYQLVDGKGPNNIGLYDTPSVRYGDLTGDGVEDAVVVLTCSFGGNAAWTAPQVYVMSGTAPAWMGRLSAVSPLGQYHEQSNVMWVDIIGGRLVTVEGVFSKSDPNCCPSGRATVIWDWNGSAIVAHGETAAPPQTPIDPAGISVDGVAPVRLGMSLIEFTAVTGIQVRASTGCGSKPITLVGDDRLFISLDEDDQIRLIAVDDPSMTTLSGAHTGTTIDELRRIYPRLEWLDFGTGDGMYAVIADDRSRGVFFSTDGEVVTGIAITYGDQPFMDAC